MECGVSRVPRTAGRQQWCCCADGRVHVVSGTDQSVVDESGWRRIKGAR